MYITVNDFKGEKMIDLSYPIKNFDSRKEAPEVPEGPRWQSPAWRSKEITVITMLSDDIQYEVKKAFTFIPPNSPGNRVLISSKTYAGREFIHLLGGVNGLTNFVNNDRVIKKNKFKGITKMIFNLNELDNSNNLEDGRSSNKSLTYYVTDDGDFTRFEPQYKRLKNGGFTSLTLRIMDQTGNVITDGLWVTVVLHICDCKI